MDTSNQTPIEAAVAETSAACWSCHGPVAHGSPFCGTCGIIQPPDAVDHFARLGLTPAYDLDDGALDQAYFDRQRLLHPDRFAGRSARERAFSQAQTVAVNDAYEVLEDPVSRAEYLIELKGLHAMPEGCLLVADQQLLLETLELREQLADAESIDDITAVERQATDDANETLGDLAADLRTERWESAARRLTRLKYFRKLTEECALRRRQMASTL